MIALADEEDEKGGCECEQTPQSDHSPGVVVNGETVVRTLFSPENVEDGIVKPNSMMMRDLKSRERGCSVDRLEQPNGSREEIAQRAGEKVTNKGGRQWVVLASISVRKIRQFLNSASAQAFCVIDTALEDNRAHADILFHAPGNENRETLQVWRGQLTQAMETEQIAPPGAEIETEAP